MLRSKSFRSMTPPKLGFLMPNKVFSGQKKFLVAPKLKKIDFLKKLPVNISGTIDFQNNPSREPKIHWQILVNIFHNLNGLQERCVLDEMLKWSWIWSYDWQYCKICDDLLNVNFYMHEKEYECVKCKFKCPKKFGLVFGWYFGISDNDWPPTLIWSVSSEVLLKYYFSS